MSARTGLTEHERSALLVPCECGHSINDHGSLIPCWMCAEDSEECGSDFEVLLLARVDTIVRARVLALLDDEAVRADCTDAAGYAEPAAAVLAVLREKVTEA